MLDRSEIASLGPVRANSPRPSVGRILLKKAAIRHRTPGRRPGPVIRPVIRPLIRPAKDVAAFLLGWVLPRTAKKKKKDI